MILSASQSFLIFLVIALCTIFTRFLPFIIFGYRDLPFPLQYLGPILPATIMAVLVVYCLKSTAFSAPALWVPQLVSVAVVVLLHLWKRQTMLSIIGGTACYMFLVQVVFA